MSVFYQQHWQSAAFQVAEIQTKNLQTPQTNLRTKTTDTANKDTASDEASDVQDGDTPLIGSWIDLSYGIQVKIEKDGTFVVWNDEQTAKGTYTYEKQLFSNDIKDVQNEEKGYVKLSDDHFCVIYF